MASEKHLVKVSFTYDNGDKRTLTGRALSEWESVFHKAMDALVEKTITMRKPPQPPPKQGLTLLPSLTDLVEEE